MLCAAPSYLARRGTPRTRADLAAHSQLRFRFPRTERFQPWHMMDAEDIATGEPAVASTNMEGVLAAALSGLGIAQLPDFMAHADVIGGRLQPVELGEGWQDHFWLVWPSSLHKTPKVLEFVDHLVTRLGAPMSKKEAGSLDL